MPVYVRRCTFPWNSRCAGRFHGGMEEQKKRLARSPVVVAAARGDSPGRHPGQAPRRRKRGHDVISNVRGPAVKSPA
jgi:hypothetical protein